MNENETLFLNPYRYIEKPNKYQWKYPTNYILYSTCFRLQKYIFLDALSVIISIFRITMHMDDNFFFILFLYMDLTVRDLIF